MYYHHSIYCWWFQRVFFVKESYYGADEILQYIYKYDERKNKIKTSYFDEKGNLKSTTEYDKDTGYKISKLYSISKKAYAFGQKNAEKTIPNYLIIDTILVKKMRKKKKNDEELIKNLQEKIKENSGKKLDYEYIESFCIKDKFGSLQDSVYKIIYLSKEICESFEGNL